MAWFRTITLTGTEVSEFFCTVVSRSSSDINTHDQPAYRSGQSARFPPGMAQDGERKEWYLALGEPNSVGTRRGPEEPRRMIPKDQRRGVKRKGTSTTETTCRKLNREKNIHVKKRKKKNLKPRISYHVRSIKEAGSRRFPILIHKRSGKPKISHPVRFIKEKQEAENSSSCKHSNARFSKLKCVRIVTLSLSAKECRRRADRGPLFIYLCLYFALPLFVWKCRKVQDENVQATCGSFARWQMTKYPSPPSRKEKKKAAWSPLVPSQKGKRHHIVFENHGRANSPFLDPKHKQVRRTGIQKIKIPHSGLVYFGKVPSSVGELAVSRRFVLGKGEEQQTGARSCLCLETYVVFMCAAGRLKRTCVVASTEKSPSVFREFFEAISHRFVPNKTWNSVLKT
ncbi:hypothetical protein ABEB36_015834 [Hypothenemus hampei]|uniref:Uncharacterized protein n=1 Tax=Hypothenemus hampei TaxID=57062 RepID=A0ABD1DYM8_HYPHA